MKGETITTARDAYALGVILYELLTGHSPYKAKATQPMEHAKEICEQEPARPSTGNGCDSAPTPRCWKPFTTKRKSDRL